MRIISGKYKGRVLKWPNIEGTRPTMDRVKESIIGMIQFQLQDAIVLDLFTGSGSVGLEMISNGAKEAHLVDKNIKVITELNKNIKILGCSQMVKTYKNDYSQALKMFKDLNMKFDVIFLDPPYKLDLTDKSLQLIKEYNLLSDEGIIICEKEYEDFGTHGFDVYKEKKYGSKKVIILKNNI